MSAYHEGIAARKKNIGKHENPYQCEIGFVQIMCGLTWEFDQMQLWQKGWDAHDKWIKEQSAAISPHPTVESPTNE